MHSLNMSKWLIGSLTALVRASAVMSVWLHLVIMGDCTRRGIVMVSLERLITTGAKWRNVGGVILVLRSPMFFAA
jgi:hypothetical protein